MPRLIRRLLLLSIVCAGAAFGQGTFGQIAYGGSWQTTFTLINMVSTATSVTLLFLRRQRLAAQRSYPGRRRKSFFLHLYDSSQRLR